MLTSSASALIAGANPQTDAPNNSDNVPVDSLSEQVIETLSSPWIESSLFERIGLNSETVRVTVITRSLTVLNQWQYDHGVIEQQKPANSGESLIALDPAEGVNHRTFWVDSEIFHKLTGVPGVIAILDAQNSPEPYDTTPFAKPPEIQPESVRSGEIHGAIDAWERGYTGEGMVVAVADTGVDFAHPDLNGTQARVTDQKSPY